MLLLLSLLTLKSSFATELVNPNYQKKTIYRTFQDQCTDFKGKKHDAIKAFDEACKSLNFIGLSKKEEHIKEMRWDIKSTSPGCATNPKTDCVIRICAKKIRCIEDQ